MSHRSDPTPREHPERILRARRLKPENTWDDSLDNFSDDVIDEGEDNAWADSDERAESLYEELEIFPEQEVTSGFGNRYRWSIPFKTIIAVLAVGVVALLGLFLWNSIFSPEDSETVPLTTSSFALQDTEGASQKPVSESAGATAHSSASTSSVQVHVAGAVKRPGLYTLESTMRWGDALKTAGGALPEADLNRINLAQPVQDGVQILVPRQGEQIEAAPQAAQASKEPATSQQASSPGTTLINLNTATAEELEELPRVGPKLAEKIIEYRESIGSFTSVEDLDGVPGIGPAMMENITPLVSVG